MIAKVVPAPSHPPPAPLGSSASGTNLFSLHALFILACVHGDRVGARRPLPPRLSARRRYFSHSLSLPSPLSPSSRVFLLLSLPWSPRSCVLDSRCMPGRLTPSEGPLALASAYKAAPFSCSLQSLSFLSLSLSLPLSLSLSLSPIQLSFSWSSFSSPPSFVLLVYVGDPCRTQGHHTSNKARWPLLTTQSVSPHGLGDEGPHSPLFRWSTSAHNPPLDIPLIQTPLSGARWPAHAVGGCELPKGGPPGSHILPVI